MFLNTGDASFADVSAATGLDLMDDGRAVALVDWDHDGDLDIWIANRNAPRVRFMRNDVASGNHFLAVRLQGTTCNRDAIGARVELVLKGDGQRRRIKTIHAGDGFLSQSSKWVHFGLGTSTDIERLIVRWPGSRASEEFSGLKADRRYKIVQGSGKAQIQSVAPRNVALRPTTPTLPPSSQRSRTLLTRRRPLPKLAYVDFDGKAHVLGQAAAGRPMLVNLWASWCRPCLSELADFAAHDEAFREKQLQVVALCTDELTPDKTSGLSAARSYLARAKLPFATGLASKTLLREMTILHNKVILMERPLPLPSSFLIDAEGQVAAIYKGPVDAAQLLKDVELLNVPRSQLQAAAYPFPGQSTTSLFDYSAVGFARAYREGGYLDDARRELRKYLEKATVPQEDAHDKKAEYQRRRLAAAHQLLGSIEQESKRYAEAAAAFRHLVELYPDETAAHRVLAVALWQQGERASAEKHFQEALRLADNAPAAVNALGMARMQLGDPDAAIAYYRQVLKTAPQDETASFNLAVALQSKGAIEEAIGQYRRTLSQHPNSLSTANNLAWLYATAQHDQHRNPREALRLAQQTCNATQSKVPAFLETLAAAHASAGDYRAAIATAQRALALATARGQLELASQLGRRLEGYRAGRPYRDLGKSQLPDAPPKP